MTGKLYRPDPPPDKNCELWEKNLTYSKTIEGNKSTNIQKGHCSLDEGNGTCLQLLAFGPVQVRTTNS